jgi:uncharacterized caspase-like protein
MLDIYLSKYMKELIGGQANTNRQGFIRALMIFCLVVSVTVTVSKNRFARSVAQTTSQGRQLDRQADVVKVWPSKAKRWALIIGVDQYRDAQINALRGSDNDAHALANALITYAGFPPDQVIVLSTDQPVERQPTRINVLTYLSNIASLVPKDGLFLFSFAGHGIERGGQAFLIPSDARLSRDISLLEESAVSVTRMHDRIKAIGVGQVIVLLDACRSDPGGRAGTPNNMTAAYTKFNFDIRNREVQAFATLYATAVGQRAYEYTEKKQGYFTWAIVEALKGSAANEKGEVTLAALLKYVQEIVPKRIAIDLGANEQQRPFAIIEGYRADDLVVSVARTTGKDSSGPGQPSIAIAPPTGNSLSVYGKYLNAKNTVSYLEIKADGSFFLSEVFSERVFQSTGKYEIDGKQITLKLEMGLATRGTVERDKISFEDGSVYFREGSQAAVEAEKTTPSKPSLVTILSANAFASPNEKVVPSILRIAGGGWDGGSDVKVIVNGKDVSNKITNQQSYAITLKGTLAELNLTKGKNEIVIVVNGVTSNTYVFKGI